MQQEQENRKLPIIEIVLGVEFYVDALKYMLIDTQDNRNTIQVRNMDHIGKHLEMVFDKSTRNIMPNNWKQHYPYDDRYERVCLYPLEYYDREGAKKLWKYEGVFAPDMIEIDIKGVTFLFDHEIALFREKDCLYNTISRADMFWDSKEVYGFYFDTKRKATPFTHENIKYMKNEERPPHIAFIDLQEIGKKIREESRKLREAKAPQKKEKKVTGPKLR